MQGLGILELVGVLCVGIVVILGLLVFLFIASRLLKRRTPPAGTYDSPHFDSGGSIGGMKGGRAYDSPDVDSGATFGDDSDRRSYDDPDIGSGASIGGGPRVGDRPGSSRRRTVSSQPKKDGGRIDHPDIDSGGSFGG